MMPERTWRAPFSGAVRPLSLLGWALRKKKSEARERALASETLEASVCVGQVEISRSQ